MDIFWWIVLIAFGMTVNLVVGFLGYVVGQSRTSPRKSLRAAYEETVKSMTSSAQKGDYSFVIFLVLLLFVGCVIGGLASFGGNGKEFIESNVRLK